jgi:hypothetical protein
MKFIVFVVLCIFLSSDLKAETSRLEILVQSMALSDDPTVQKIAAKIVFNHKIRTTEIIDILAYRLGTEAGKNYDNDLVSWYAKAIGEAGHKRYYSLLQHIEKTSQDKKIKNYAKKAMLNLTDTSMQGDFVLETFDINKIRKASKIQYDKNLVFEKSFETIDNSKDVNYVLEKLGMPNSISQELVPIKRPYVGSIVTQRLILKYEGLGSIRFGHADGKLLVEQVHKSIEFSPEMAASENGDLITLILSGTPMEYRETAKTIYIEKRFSNDVLDAAAKRIWADKALDDKFSIDGVAWLLKCIGASGNSRYKTLLTNLDNKSTHSKIRRYALNAKKVLLDMEAEQFIP